MDKRPLTLLERQILNKLLSVSFPGSEELSRQLVDCEAATTGDDDNYGSIYLFTKVKEPADVSLRVPVEGLVGDIDGGTVDVLLHVVDGFINELEIVKLDGTPLKAQINPENIEVHINH